MMFHPEELLEDALVELCDGAIGSITPVAG
jgi:hypothetical protein